MIFDAMNDVFARGGVQELTMDAISRQVGMSKRTVYTLFNSREGLLAEYLEQVSETFVRPLPAEATDWPLCQRLIAMLRPPANPGAFDLSLAVLRILISIAPDHPNLARKVLASGRYRIETLVRLELIRANENGEITTADPHNAARLLCDMVRTDPLVTLLDPDQTIDWAGMTDRVDFAVGVFLDGIAAH